MERYYIEFVDTDSQAPYLIQTKWFETKEEAKEWFRENIEFNKLDAYLMTAEFNEDYYDIIYSEYLG